MSDDLYNADLVLWAQAQAQALRDAGRGVNVRAIDYENVAEEIESLARSDRRALASHIATILQHLMKLEASPATDPRRSWEDAIDAAREHADELLAESPSLRPEVAGMIGAKTEAARIAVERSLARYGETATRDLRTLRYTEAQVLGDWLPRSGG